MDVLRAFKSLRSTSVYCWPASMRANQTAAHEPSGTVGNSSLSSAAPSMLSAPPAAARSLEDVAANVAIPDAACTPGPDLEAPLEKSSMGERICRICLSAGSADLEVIQPCACTGTIGYIHAACLAAWVQERGSLTCEICQQQYKEPFVQELQQQQQTAAAGEGHEEGQTGGISCCNWMMNYGIGQVIAFLIITACFVSFAVFVGGGVGAVCNQDQTTVAPAVEAVPPPPPGSASMQTTPAQANANRMVSSGHIQSSPLPCGAAARARFRMCP